MAKQWLVGIIMIIIIIDGNLTIEYHFSSISRPCWAVFLISMTQCFSYISQLQSIGSVGWRLGTKGWIHGLNWDRQQWEAGWNFCCAQRQCIDRLPCHLHSCNTSQKYSQHLLWRIISLPESSLRSGLLYSWLVDDTKILVAKYHF